MAGRNIELLRGGFDAFAEEGPDALTRLAADDFELVTTAEVASEPDTFRGQEGLQRYWDSFYEAMEGFELEAHEMTPVGDEAVVADVTLRATGRSSGITTEMRTFHIWTIRDGKAQRLEFATTLEGAMEIARAQSQ
jgi:ketosteroid isomerase-like protein